MRTREDPWTDRESMYVAFIGKLFLQVGLSLSIILQLLQKNWEFHLQMLKCIIIPLIIPSLISAVGSLGEIFIQ